MCAEREKAGTPRSREKRERQSSLERAGTFWSGENNSYLGETERSLSTIVKTKATCCQLDTGFQSCLGPQLRVPIT